MSLTGGLAAASQTYCLADEGSELRSAIKKERNDHAPVSAENLSSYIL